MKKNKRNKLTGKQTNKKKTLSLLTIKWQKH